ncbi:hypothetical protein C8T65DRAFT_100063 [Cerioporus squamosus]|nr:hypothetical protein C8T65DRAFT_100063 [Cerioporus squamosus]
MRNVRTIRFFPWLADIRLLTGLRLQAVVVAVLWSKPRLALEERRDFYSCLHGTVLSVDSSHAEVRDDGSSDKTPIQVVAAPAEVYKLGSSYHKCSRPSRNASIPDAQSKAPSHTHIMMSFAIAAVALAALSQVVQATPLSPVATSVKPFSEGVTVAARFPVHELGSVAAHSNVTVTLPSGGVHSDVAAAIFPATLLLCPSTNCLSCFAFDLSTLPENVCLMDNESSFYSVAINQPSNQGLPFLVVTGPVGCSAFAAIPNVNECFNINNPPYFDFAILT